MHKSDRARRQLLSRQVGHTPDVVGIRKSKQSDVIAFPTEIVSAEVKIDSTV